MRMRKWGAGLAMLVCLSGCGESAIINKIKLAQTMGYDLEKEGIRSTLLLPMFNKREEVKMVELETVSDSFDDVYARMNTKTNLPIEYGQMKMVVFGREFAEKGLEAIIQSFCHDPEIGSWLQLGVAEGQAAALLKMREKSQIPYFIYGLINQNRDKGNLPETNLQTFLIHYYGEGQDPFLPYLTSESGAIKVDGTALFRHDKYVTHIGMKETFLLKALLGKGKRGEYMVPLQDGTADRRNPNLLLNNIHSRVDYRINRESRVPSVGVHLKLTAQVKDVPEPFKMNQREQQQALENQVASYFTEEFRKLIAFLQEKRVDPVGFGEIFRRKSRSWKEEAFHEAYPQMETHVEVQVKLKMTGVGE